MQLDFEFSILNSQFSIVNCILSVAGLVQVHAVVGGHELHQVFCVAQRAGLVAGMHGQLGQTDVHRGHGDVSHADAAQGGATGDIRTVAIAPYTRLTKG